MPASRVEAPGEPLRSAFLGSAYGPPGARLRLSPERGRAPGWVRRGEPWAIVTAWNPGAQPAELRENLRAHAELLATVQAARLLSLPAQNGAGAWAEASLLILGASLPQTLTWTRHFGQEAALWGVGARAALIWRTGHTERHWAVRVEAGEE